jgi:hypothetical protein
MHKGEHTMSHFDRRTGFLHRPALALAVLAIIVLVLGLAYPAPATAIAVILTFEVVAKLPQKHMAIMYVATNPGQLTVVVAIPASSNTIWAIQPAPSEADFLAAFPKAVSVTSMGGG